MISVTKDGIKFSTSGDIGSANITVRYSRCCLLLAANLQAHARHSTAMCSSITEGP